MRAHGDGGADVDEPLEPPVEAAVLIARVLAEVDRRQAASARRGAAVRYGISLASAAAVAVVMLKPRPVPSEASVPMAAVDQMERTVNRELAARYLQEAEGVLVSVTTALPRCERPSEGRDAAPEARRSRDLLARRRLLIDGEAEPLAAARPLLDDVDHLLGRVAAIDRCARPEEVAEIARKMADEHLLMKIDLLARELMG